MLTQLQRRSQGMLAESLEQISRKIWSSSDTNTGEAELGDSDSLDRHLNCTQCSVDVTFGCSSAARASFFISFHSKSRCRFRLRGRKWTESQCRVRVNEGKTFIFNFSIKMLLFSAVQRIKRGRTMRRTFSFSLTHNKQTNPEVPQIEMLEFRGV